MSLRNTASWLWNLIVVVIGGGEKWRCNNMKLNKKKQKNKHQLYFKADFNEIT